MRHPASRKLSHVRVACNNPFDRVRAFGMTVRQDACGEKWFITEKPRYDLRKVTQLSFWPVFVIKRKVARFETLAATLTCHQTDSGFSEDSTKISVCRLISPPLQEEEFHHASLLMLVLFD
jgi:hypothetical protein